MVYYGVQVVPVPGAFYTLKEMIPAYKKLLEKNGAKSVHSFVVTTGSNVGSIAHMVGYDDIASAAKGNEGLHENKDWRKLQEKGAPLIASLTINTLNPVE